MSKPFIHIVEVGPRDGLQNENKIFSPEMRVQLIDHLSECGFSEIEVGSFVSPKWVPQMANTDKVYQHIHHNPKCRYSALVPNERGMKDAMAAGLRCVSLFTQKNTNSTIAESLETFKHIMDVARDQEVRVRGYVSCVISCPFEGDVSPDAVATIAEHLFKLGCAEISLGDTIGRGTPHSIEAMLKAVMERVPVGNLAIHCHDTFGHAVDNVIEALNQGIRVVDSAINGLGGCPYASKNGERAKGNVATEAIVAALEEKGYAHGINIEALGCASAFVKEWIKF